MVDIKRSLTAIHTHTHTHTCLPIHIQYPIHTNNFQYYFEISRSILRLHTYKLKAKKGTTDLWSCCRQKISKGHSMVFVFFCAHIGTNTQRSKRIESNIRYEGICRKPKQPGQAIHLTTREAGCVRERERLAEKPTKIGSIYSSQLRVSVAPNKYALFQHFYFVL